MKPTVGPHHRRPPQQQQQPDAPTTMISTDKNLMPSMVARLQHQHQLSQSSSRSANNNEPSWPPRGIDNLTEPTPTQRQMFDQDGLVLPRRVPHHPPCQIGGQQPTTIRDLNRELKFNQIRGNNVLDKKSELKKALEKLEATKRRKEAEQERLTRRTSLELRLEERAERIAKESGTSNESSAIGNCNSPTSGQQLANFTIKSSSSR